MIVVYMCVINLGKEPGTKAYRLYDPKGRRVHVSRDVTFGQEKAWPWESLKDNDIDQTDYFYVNDVQLVDVENTREI